MGLLHQSLSGRDGGPQRSGTWIEKARGSVVEGMYKLVCLLIKAVLEGGCLCFLISSES